MLTHRPVAVALGALSACAAVAGGGVALQDRILGFAAWPPSGPPPEVPAIAAPRIGSALRIDPPSPRRGNAAGRHRRADRRDAAAMLPSSLGPLLVAGGHASVGRAHRPTAVPVVRRDASALPGRGGGITPRTRHVDPPTTVVERHPAVPDAVTGGGSDGVPAVPITVVPLPALSPYGSDRPSAAGPRLVGAPAEHAPAADLEPVSSAADNAPAPSDPGAPALEPNAGQSPAPPVASEPQPVPAEPAPPADQGTPVVEVPVPSPASPPADPVPEVPATPADPTPPADPPQDETAATGPSEEPASLTTQTTTDSAPPAKPVDPAV